LIAADESGGNLFVSGVQYFGGFERIKLNPAKNLKFEEKSKGVQFFLPMAEWQNKKSVLPV